MPSTIYLNSGDEFTVTQPYAVALDRWTARTPAAWSAEFNVVHWRDPKYCVPDDDDDEPDPHPWPAYREQLVTIDLTTIVAVERLEGAAAAIIERSRQHEADRANGS